MRVEHFCSLFAYATVIHISIGIFDQSKNKVGLCYKVCLSVKQHQISNQIKVYESKV